MRKSLMIELAVLLVIMGSLDAVVDDDDMDEADEAAGHLIAVIRKQKTRIIYKTKPTIGRTLKIVRPS